MEAALSSMLTKKTAGWGDYKVHKQVRITREMWAEIQEASRDTGWRASEVMRQFLADGLDLYRAGKKVGRK